MEVVRNPWFVGIVASIIAGLILYFLFSIWKPKRKHQSNNPTAILQQNIQQNAQEVSPTVSVKTPKSNISPEEIFKYLDSLPPFQREAAAQNYKDIKVHWNVKFSNYFSTGEIHYLVLKYKDSLFSDILCQVDLVKYPEFKIIKKGQEFTVEGTISSVDDKVNLENCTFSFDTPNF